MDKKEFKAHDMHEILIHNIGEDIKTKEYFIDDFLIESQCNKNELLKIVFELYPDQVKEMKIQQSIIKNEEINCPIDGDILNGIMFMDILDQNNELIDRIKSIYYQKHSSEEIVEKIKIDEKGIYHLFMTYVH